MNESYTVREAGKRAYIQGWSFEDNPYKEGSHKFNLWSFGWADERQRQYEDTFFCECE